MSALIHTVSAETFKGEMTDAQRLAFLGQVASEFLTKTGRGKNIKTVLALPTTYSPLFDRRVRQAAKLANGDTKPTDAQVEATTAKVMAAATKAAEKAAAAKAKADAKAEGETPKAPRKPRAPKAEVEPEVTVEQPAPETPVEATEGTEAA